MIWPTIFALLLLIIIKLKINKGLIISPSVVIGALFAFSLFVLSVVLDDWSVTISGTALSLIILSFLLISIGEIISISIYNRFKKNRTVSVRLKLITISNRKIVYHSMIMALMFLYVLYQIKIIANGGGASGGGLDQILQAARTAIISDDAKLDLFGAIFNAIAQGFYFGYVYVFVNNFILTKSVLKNIRYLIIPLIFVLFAILSTTRTVFAIMIVYFLGIYTILQLRSTKDSYLAIIKKMLKPIGIMVLLFVLMFQVMGSVRGSIQQFTSPLQSFEVYVASPIVALSRSTADNRAVYNRDFGACTLSNISEKFGKKLKGCDNGFVQYDYTPDYGQFAYTNVYTGISPFYKDYGIVGVSLIMIVIGAFYAFVLSKSLRTRPSDSIKWTIIYSIMLYAPFMFIFDDQFTELAANITLWLACFVGISLVKKFIDDSKNNMDVK